MDPWCFIGTIASLIGLLISFLSWRAAVKAKDAATTAVNQIRGIDAVAETTRLTMICETSVSFLESGSFELAKKGVSDIMKGIVLLKNNQTTKQHLDENEWTEITTNLAEIRDYLSEVIDSQDEEKKQACKQNCSPIFWKINVKLIEVSTAAKNRAGKGEI